MRALTRKKEKLAKRQEFRNAVKKVQKMFECFYKEQFNPHKRIHQTLRQQLLTELAKIKIIWAKTSRKKGMIIEGSVTFWEESVEGLKEQNIDMTFLLSKDGILHGHIKSWCYMPHRTTQFNEKKIAKPAKDVFPKIVELLKILHYDDIYQIKMETIPISEILNL